MTEAAMDNSPIDERPEGAQGDDLSALAWVNSELRRSLETAHKALRRYLKEAEGVGGSDVDAVDPSVLRGARVQLHQGAGALELVGLPVPALVLRASESAVQRMVAKPSMIDAAAVETIERTSFALLDFLGRLLARKPLSAVALFPQYRAVQTLAAAERIHPADLWLNDWVWHELPPDLRASARPADDDARGKMESLVLALMRKPSSATWARMSDLCADLGAGAEGRLATLWQMAAAFFEAQSHALLDSDVYSKRIASRLLAQLRATVKGSNDLSDRLAQDLLFFCAHAKAPAEYEAPRLSEVRQAWQLDDSAAIDYDMPRLGRFDPVLIAQARKRVAGAKDAWSAVAGGELHRLAGLAEQFALVGDSLQRLFPSGEILAGALQIAVAQTVAAGVAPPAPLAMEVATSILYLDASLEDGELDHPELSGRVQRMARRIDDVRIGADPQPLESWMEELYRRVSDRQTMGSVVQELRAALSEVEKQIDQYFRDPSQRQVLIPVPSQLSAMRGVLSVLGMGQASQAVLHMRDDVDALAQTEVDPHRAVQAGTFDRLADNLGALSFLIDMLSVQPTLAKSLFRFDPQTGSLSAVMGRSERISAFAAFDDEQTTVRVDDLAPLETLDLLPPPPPAQPPAPMPSASAPATIASGLEDDVEMREIFIEEAREVIANARVSLEKLNEQPEDLGEMTAVRRAFHTLKGSGRMVGQRDFGEAAWACEQLFNARLAQSSRMDPPLRGFTIEALDYLDGWTEAIAARRDDGHASPAVVRAADALRLDGERLTIETPKGADAGTTAGALPVEELPAFAALPAETAAPVVDDALPVPEVGEVGEDLEAFDFDAAVSEPESLVLRVPDLPSSADLDFDLPAPAEAPAQPDFSLDLDSFEADAAEPVLEDSPAVEPLLPALEPLPEPDLPAAAGEAVEVDLADFDFGDLGVPLPEAPAEAKAAAETQSDPLPERVAEELAAPEADPPWPAELPVELEPLAEMAAAEPPVEAAAVADDEQVKVIGPLRISIPLFNIYLSEADELSRRLGIELAEWALEYEHHPVPESAAALAHSLAGNSATVGYADLSALARSLEHALMRSHDQGRGRPGEPELFNEAAEEVRRLLHQFAAGFLHEVDPSLMQRLAEHERWPTAAPPADLARDEDEIDSVDAIDAELFPIFEDEAEELLPQLMARLRDWADRPGDPTAASACMRTLHTFKGGARLAGAMRLGEMAHRLETAIEHLLAGSEVHSEDVDPLLARADTMLSAFEALRKPTGTPAPVPEVVRVEPVPEAPALEVPLALSEQTLVLPPGDLPAESVADAPDLPPVSAATPVHVDWSRFSPVQPLQSVAAERPAPAGSAAVRVRSGLLDRLVNQAGEVSITRARIDADVRQLQGSLNELTDSLERMRRQLRDIELQAETQMSSRLEAAKASSAAFDPLEMDRFTRFQELTRFMAESVNDVATLQRSLQRTLQSTEDELATQARLTRELQDDLLRTRMIEFDSLADRLYRTVRQAAKETARQVRLDIVGGAIEIDRGVLERMTGPFEHLLRNCVAHGIESPERREELGKDRSGSITVTITQEGNEVGVEVRDDGAGLNLARIRERGLERGLIDAGTEPDDAQLSQLIFAPGFSTAQSVTELAGRGVGLDVVRSEVNAMGGRVQVTSQPDQGTSFRLLLPLTTAVTQVVMLRCGELSVAVPSTVVEIVRRAPAAEVELGYSSGSYRFADQDVPFFWLAALLQAGARGSSTARMQPVVVIRSATQRVALHVDEVLGNQEVVVKNVGPQLSRLPGLAGVTLLPSGRVALIYNPVALATLYGPAARARMLEVPSAAQAAIEAAPAPVVSTSPLVLVVDDSLTVRRVTQRLLVREGYRVVTAKDGLDALEKLAEGRPSVMLTDIEMPRMDGFDLVRNVRADAQLADLAVIMITSRIAQKHRDYAATLGVDHYLGKPYSEEELLSLVARYAGADIPT
jgi:chemosensory pili system protein ChpA (sensor histidine kinase/response regulator)